MTESLTELLQNLSRPTAGQDLDFVTFALLLLLSALSSMVISYLYLTFYSSRATGSHIHLAFPLLAVSVTAIFVTIQFSLPLSLGLLGALSIVRFRTPIKEGEEVAFIMLVIASSLACASLQLVGLAAILAVATLALVARRLAPGVLEGSANDGSLVLTLDPEVYDARSEEMQALLRQRLRHSRVESLTRDGDEVVLTFTFRSISSADLVELETAIRSAVEPRQLVILYNRQGGL